MTLFHISVRWPNNPGSGLDHWADGFNAAVGTVADAMQTARDENRPADITIHTHADREPPMIGVEVGNATSTE